MMFESVEQAQKYLDDCRHYRNQTSENYLDRVRAARFIRLSSQDDADVKKASSTFSNEETMPVERKEKPLPEFVKITKEGQSVAGRIVRFGKGKLGTHFVILSPIFLRDQQGGQWEKYGEAAVNLSTDMLRKVDLAKDAGKFLVFNYTQKVATEQGGEKKIFRVLELDDKEIKELDGKAKNNGNAKPPAAAKPEPSDYDDEDPGF